MVNAFKGLSEHNATQLAAGMSYYALLAVFPAFLVVAAGAGFVLDDPGSRQEVVDFLLRELPLASGQGAADVEKLIDGVVDNSGSLGLVGAVALLISASALISSARTSISVVFGDEEQRGALRGKALDLLLMLGLGLLFALSFAATVVIGLDLGLGTGGIGAAIEDVLDLTGAVLPIVISAAVFAVLYTVLPAARPPLRDLWPGAIFAALGLEVLKRGFSIYLDNFADYGAVYGSLGAVIAFMFFAYLASVVFLLGAEMAALWPRVRRGEMEGEPDPRPLGQKVRDAISGLFRRKPRE